MTSQQMLAGFLDSQDFYELMQAYRHAPIDVATPFEAVRLALYTASALPVQSAVGDWVQSVQAVYISARKSKDLQFIPSEVLDAMREILLTDKALPVQAERNFCERCGQRLGDDTYIHTCTPPESKA